MDFQARPSLNTPDTPKNRTTSLRAQRMPLPQPRSTIRDARSCDFGDGMGWMQIQEAQIDRFPNPQKVGVLLSSLAVV